jgi:hypothetical protein
MLFQKNKRRKEKFTPKIKARTYLACLKYPYAERKLMRIETNYYYT